MKKIKNKVIISILMFILISPKGYKLLVSTNISDGIVWWLVSPNSVNRLVKRLYSDTSIDYAPILEDDVRHTILSLTTPTPYPADLQTAPMTTLSYNNTQKGDNSRSIFILLFIIFIILATGLVIVLYLMKKNVNK